MSMEDKKISNDQLEEVSGGTVEEIQKIIDLFRKYGFNSEADKLSKSGIFFFADRFNEILKGLGYTQRLEILASYEDQNNFNTYNGDIVTNLKFMDILEEFLYKKSKNIEID